MKLRKLSFEELVAKNKQEILNDKQALEQLEIELENKKMERQQNEKQTI